MPSRDCVLFVTHRWSPSVAAHYARLKREAGTVLDVYLVYQASSPEAVPAGVSPDVVLTLEDIASVFPQRFAQYRTTWTFHSGELAWMAAVGRAPLSAYERVWALEYDVDFSGNWATFFGAAVGYEGDLLGLDLRYRHKTPKWPNATDYEQPAYAPPEPVIGFFPIVRASRRLIDSYRNELEAEGWKGHFEIVLPSLALAKGFSVSEIGGDSGFTPNERRGLHYSTPALVGHAAATFLFRPPRSFRYFVEAPRSFRQPNRLYHPVKTDLPLGDRIALSWRKFGHHWVAFRNRMLRRG